MTCHWASKLYSFLDTRTTEAPLSFTAKTTTTRTALLLLSTIGISITINLAITATMRLLLAPLTAFGWSCEADFLKRKLRSMKKRLDETEFHRRKQSVLLFFAYCQLHGERAKFRDFLSLEGMQRRDRRIPRACLNDPDQSAWSAVFRSQNDQAYITVTGFDVAKFNTLLGMFAPLFNSYTPWTGSSDGATFIPYEQGGRGRPRKVTAASCLGLILAYYRFRGAEFALQGWFGLTGTATNVWLRCF